MSQAMNIARSADVGPLPAHDLIAEQSVLGGMMLSADVIDEVTETLIAEDFYRPAHAAIYQAILALYSDGDPTDPVAVAAELESRGELSRAGGAPYLHTLIATVPTVANAAYYASIVAEKAQLRRLGEAGARIQQYAYAAAQGDVEPADVRNRAQAELDTAIDDRGERSGYARLSDLRDAQLASLRDVQSGRVDPGLGTGLLDLDAVVGGWRPGQFIVFAGRPGLGKSALGVDMALAASIKHGKTSAIFSLEMSATEIWQRIIAAEARVRLTDIRTPHSLSRSDYERITDALDRIDAAGQLIIDDTSTITVAEIRAKARRIKARHGLNLLVVDYLQLMNSNRRHENRQVEVSEFSRQLKILAKELEIPVIGLSQLNRGPEQRQDKRPMLSDLRESGALEQDADIVILVHRPDAYDREDPRSGEADLIVAKNRNGPTTTVTVAHQLHYSRFADLART